MGRLASSIAHEINNPLEAVINLLYLTRQAQTLEEAHRFASEAEMEINRVAQITTHTLRFHREQKKPSPTDIIELLESVLVLFRGKTQQSQVRVHFEKDDCPQLICFPDEIRQVAANLIRNAIEAMPNGGDLQLRVRPATDWRSGEEGVRVTIADNGEGMSIETRRRIYEPFYTTKGSVGTGLGLWVTAGILRKHRGGDVSSQHNTLEKQRDSILSDFPLLRGRSLRSELSSYAIERRALHFRELLETHPR